MRNQPSQDPWARYNYEILQSFMVWAGTNNSQQDDYGKILHPAVLTNSKTMVKEFE